MKKIIIAIYGMAITLILLCSVFYPSTKDWSYLAAASFGIHFVLAFVISLRNMLDAAKISVWLLQVISATITAGLLIPYSSKLGDWWLIVASMLISFTALVTLIVTLVFTQGGFADVKTVLPNPPQE